MKLKVEGNKILVSMSDEGRRDFVVEISFRLERDQIVPTIVFPREEQLTDVDVKRILRSVAPLRVHERGRSFPFHVVNETADKSRSLQTLKRLGSIASGR